MTEKPRGQIVSRKILRKDQNCPKVVKNNERTRKWSNNVKVASRKCNFSLKRGKIKILKRAAYKKVVAMVRSNLMDKDLAHQIVPR